MGVVRIENVRDVNVGVNNDEGAPQKAEGGRKYWDAFQKHQIGAKNRNGAIRCENGNSVSVRLDSLRRHVNASYQSDGMGGGRVVASISRCDAAKSESKDAIRRKREERNLVKGKRTQRTVAVRAVEGSAGRGADEGAGTGSEHVKGAPAQDDDEPRRQGAEGARRRRTLGLVCPLKGHGGEGK